MCLSRPVIGTGGTSALRAACSVRQPPLGAASAGAEIRSLWRADWPLWADRVDRSCRIACVAYSHAYALFGMLTRGLESRPLSRWDCGLTLSCILGQPCRLRAG